VGSLKLYI
jgi:hypothetical protein